MEVISSKSFEEDSSEVENKQIDNNNYNSDNYYENNLENKLDYNNITEEEFNEELENNDIENNSNEMEMNRINEINELDEDEEETDGKMENNIEAHYEENEISNSVQNIENNTINTIDEENDEYNENSMNTNTQNNTNNNIIINENIGSNNNLPYPISLISNKQNIQGLIENNINKQIPLVLFDNEKFIIPDEAKKLLTLIGNNRIGIISFLGQYNSMEDKYILINKIISNNSEIELIDNQNNNKGILIYSKPLIVKNNFCNEEYPCFVIDTINFDMNINNDDEINNDSKIFIIIIIICSLFIFNSKGTIDENALININSILNLKKFIKLRNALKEENEMEIAGYFPALLWILQNSFLKLEDKSGNTITEKQYMEASLQIMNGDTDSIEEKNRIKTLIKQYFLERDCFIMMDPISISKKEKNNNNINIKELKINLKYLDQIDILKNKIIKKIKPKMFYNHYLTGNMLIYLIESILNSINSGGIPILSNSWKYIMKCECMKYTNDLILRFANELKEYRNENIIKNTFYNDNQIEKHKIKIIKKYIKEYMNNNIIDEETKMEFIEKVKNKLELELKKYENENEKYFEEKFIKDLNLLSNKFMENFTSSDIYEKNSYKFFQDFENFRETAFLSGPDFPKKNEILFDKVLLIIKKFINGKIMKIKVINEEKNYLENENKKQNEKINELNNELNMIKEKNNEFIQKLNNDILMEKKKYKRTEEKINGLINNKTKELENLKKKIEIETNNYENKIKEIIETNNNLDKEMKVKDEQLIVMKINNEKISSLYEQKSKLLEKEISNWKDKYTNIIKDSMNKENDLNKENIKLKEQNKLLMKKEKNKKEDNVRIINHKSNNINNKYNTNINENININININKSDTKLNIENENENEISNLNNNSNINNPGNTKIKSNINSLMNYIKMNFKDKRNKMIKLDKFFLNKKKDDQEEIKEKSIEKDNKLKKEKNLSNNDMNDSNQKQNSSKNKNVSNKSYDNSNSKEFIKKVKNGQLINFTKYQDIINNDKDYKCKFCLKTFSFQEFKEHYNICTKNPINISNLNNSNTIYDNENKENHRVIKSSNSNTVFTSERINCSHNENELNNDNMSMNKSTLKKFTISNSSINNSINNIIINNTNLNNSKNINSYSNNENINTNKENRGIITNKIFNYRNKKDNNYSNNNISNSSITNNNSDNASIFGNNNKKKYYRNINLFFYNNNNSNNINMSNNKINSNLNNDNNDNNDNNENNNNDNNKDNDKNDNNINNGNNILNPQKLKINIIKGRIRKDKSGKPYLEYIININYDNIKNWNINRRFSQFTNLYRTLRTICRGSFELPESANIFNNITSLFSCLSHENKIIQLEKFLKDLTETDGINNSKHLYCFLELNHLIDDNNNNKKNNKIKNEITKSQPRKSIDSVLQNKSGNILVINNKPFYNSAGLSENISEGASTPINSNINTNRFKINNGILEYRI